MERQEQLQTIRIVNSLQGGQSPAGIHQTVAVNNFLRHLFRHIGFHFLIFVKIRKNR